jgi:hypothetical protein
MCEPHGYTEMAADGLWGRFKGMVLAMDRLDRLESATDFVGWLDALPDDQEQIDEAATELTLRAFRLAADPVSYRMLVRLRSERGVPFVALMEETGLGRVPASERVNDLVQAGLAVKDMATGSVQATLLTDGLVGLIDEVRMRFAQTITERLPELAPR